MTTSRKRNLDDDLNDESPKYLRGGGGGGYGDDADDLFNDDELFEDNLVVDHDGDHYSA